MTHMRTNWQVVAKCCADTKNKSPLFPCNEIPDGTSLDAEQAFSTACKQLKFVLNINKRIFLVKVGWENNGYGCIGKSHFCQWSDTSTKYSAINANDGQGISGACVKDCTAHCSNYFCDGKCFKSYGWYPGFEPYGTYKWSTCKIRPRGKIGIGIFTEEPKTKTFGIS